MLIDWFTVGAQLLNFLILVVLLRRFLYGPILRAMGRREERIAARFREGEEKAAEASRRLEEVRRQEAALEKERARKTRQAEEEAEERRRELLRRAKEESEEVRAAWMEGLRREKESFFGEFKRRAAEEVLHISRRAVQDLADEDFDHRMVEVFTRRLESLGGGEREQLAAAVKDGKASVRTPVELNPVLKRRITAALHLAAGGEVPVGYTVDEDMAPPGIELNVSGIRLSWGVGSYFDAMERYLCGILDLSSGECQGERPGR